MTNCFEVSSCQMAKLAYEFCHLTENGCSLAFNLRIKKFKLEIKNKIKNSLTNPLFLCTTSESWHRRAEQKRKCEKSRNTFFSKNGFSFLVLSKLTSFFHWIWSSPFPFCRRPERNNKIRILNTFYIWFILWINLNVWKKLS